MKPNYRDKLSLQTTAMQLQASSTEKFSSTSQMVLMLPFLAHGHTSPFLELARKLTDRGIHIYLCSTAINLSSISKEIKGKCSQSIRLVEFHLPELRELPPHYHTTNGLPAHLQPVLYEALKLSNSEIHNVIKSLKPDLVIYDTILSWLSITPLGTFPSVWFQITSAAFLSYTLHLLVNSSSEYPFPAIYFRDFEFHKLLAAAGDKAPVAGEVYSFPMLVNTSRAMEGKYLDHIAGLTNMKTLAVGPLIPTGPIAAAELGEENIELMNWLGQKDVNSTVFTSFGTMYFPSEEEIKEIAHGLELSNVNFIWALRSPDGDDSSLEEILPTGFLERVRGRGRIVQGWAPQAMILGHSSIGGFLSHCGWISLSEGIEFGVPIIAMPMNLEQPLNGRVLVENGVAVEVMRDENGRLKGEEIAKMINHVVIGGAGETMRQKMKDLRKKIKSSEEDNLDELLTLIAQLSEKNSGQDPNIAGGLGT